jgi:hypothetical protein
MDDEVAKERKDDMDVIVTLQALLKNGKGV